MSDEIDDNMMWQWDEIPFAIGQYQRSSPEEEKIEADKIDEKDRLRRLWNEKMTEQGEV